MKIIKLTSGKVAFATDAGVIYDSFPSDNAQLKQRGESTIEIYRNTALMVSIDVTTVTATQVQPNAEVAFAGTVSDLITLLNNSFFYPSSTIASTGQLLTSDFLLEVAKGNVPGHSLVRQFGFVAAVGASLPQTIWRKATLYSAGFPAAAVEINVVSNNAADTDGGTGAETILVTGLDSNFEEKTESFTLNGITPVSNGSFWTRISKVEVTSAGSGGANAGVIDVYESGDPTAIYASIAIGKNRSDMAVYTIPAGKTGYIIKKGFQTYDGDPTTQNNSQIEFFARPSGGVFQSVDVIAAADNNSTNDKYYYSEPLTEQTDVRVDVVDLDADMNVMGEFVIVLVDN